MFKTIKGSALILYKYFKPSLENISRTVGFISAVVIVPVINIVLPKVLFKEDNHPDSSSDNNSVITNLAAVTVVSILNGFQQSLSTALTTSTMQAMRKNNIQLLTDKSKFLIHGDTKEITSFQYVTVGLGVRDFAANAVSLFVVLPMYIISSTSILINIITTTSSLSTLAIVSIFSVVSNIFMYFTYKGYFSYQIYNQKIENELVAKVAFIEAHRSAVSLMDVANTECQFIKDNLYKIDNTIVKMSLLCFSYYFSVSASQSVASQFLGIYYKDNNIGRDNEKILNIMLMSLITNLQNVVFILTGSYSFTKLNLEQLQAFYKAYNQCLSIRDNNNKLTQIFEGDKIKISNLNVYKPNLENLDHNLTLIIQKVNLELFKGKVYKLSAPSGMGKTTFLKAITNNWQYTEGTITLPESVNDSISFIPQNSFITTGSLLEILTYPLKPVQFYKEIKESKLDTPLLMMEDNITQDNCLRFNKYIISLLKKADLFPKTIKEEELTSTSVIWSERLSGGEKQKIAIIRALLSQPKLIIMDEAMSALDLYNKKLMYSIIKDYTKESNCMVIYTEHDSIDKGFTDGVLNIIGQDLILDDYMN